MCDKNFDYLWKRRRIDLTKIFERIRTTHLSNYNKEILEIKGTLRGLGLAYIWKGLPLVIFELVIQYTLSVEDACAYLITYTEVEAWSAVNQSRSDKIFSPLTDIPTPEPIAPFELTSKLSNE